MRSEQAVAAMSCPICRTGLTLSERQGIEIDYCPTCRGVWLDRGELDKLIERSTEAAAPARPAPGPGDSWTAGRAYGDDGDRHRHHGHRHRKKSFLSEFFD
jgi:Zn-finger nucleic acid-binding protein